MYRDEIIEEVWRIRDDYVKRHHYSLDEIVEDLQGRQSEHPTKIVDRRRHPVEKPRETASP